MITRLTRLATWILSMLMMSFSFQARCEELDDTIRINVWVKTAEITNHDLVEYIRENIVPEAIKNDYNRNYDFLEIFDSPLSTQDTIFVIAIRPSCPNVKKEILTRWLNYNSYK